MARQIQLDGLLLGLDFDQLVMMEGNLMIMEMIA